MRLGLAVASVVGLLGSLVSAPALAGEVAPSSPLSTAAKQGDGKRREVVFLDADVGPAYVDTIALKDGDLLDPGRVKTGGFGFAYGAAVGARLHEFTFAVCYRRGEFSDWQLSTLGGEVAMSFTLDRTVPHFGVGAAYASLTGIVADLRGAPFFSAPPAVDISGLNVSVHVGADYYVTSWFSVGATLSGDAFFLRRKGDHLIRSSSGDPNSTPLTFPNSVDGSGNGLGATLSLVLGLHY